ncbi:MAG: DUF5803 family protein [Halobaculum sp.]
MIGSKRRAALGLVVLLALSGCTGVFGGGSVSDERLDAQPPGPYDWNSSADADITLYANTTFAAVYDADGAEMRLFRRDGFGGRNPLSVEAVRYQYPNGTVISGTELAERGEIRRTRGAVIVEFPNGDVEGDELAFTGESSPKRFALPTYVTGTYEISLPPGRRIGLPVFGRVSPPASQISDPGSDDRVTVRIEKVESDTVVAQFYLPRDIRLLAGLLLVGGLVAGGGVAYYLRQIRQLQAEREELGLDVDTDDDDFGRDPPPGMG